MRKPTVAELKALVEKSAATASPRPSPDPSQRAAAAHRSRNLQLARAAMSGSTLDVKALDALALEREQVRQKLAQASRARILKDAPAQARRLARLTPPPSVPLAVVAPWQPGSFIVDTVTFVRTFAGAGSER